MTAPDYTPPALTLADGSCNVADCPGLDRPTWDHDVLAHREQDAQHDALEDQCFWCRPRSGQEGSK